MRSLVGRTRLLALIGLLTAAPVLAGPAGAALAPDAARRAAAALLMEETRTTARRAPSLDELTFLRALDLALAPLVGEAGTRSVRVLPANEWFELARDRGEPDATLLFDRAKDELVALDRPLDQDRLRLLVHVAACAHAERARGTRPSPWFEEGLAGYAATLEVTTAVARIGRPDADRRARVRLELAHGPAALERLFTLERGDFLRGERVHRNVALAGEVVHYLLHGGTRARRAFDAYVETLHRTHDPDAADRALLRAMPLATLARGLADSVR